jgi:hypothetical protein
VRLATLLAQVDRVALVDEGKERRAVDAAPARCRGKGVDCCELGLSPKEASGKVHLCRPVPVGEGDGLQAARGVAR